MGTGLGDEGMEGMEGMEVPAQFKQRELSAPLLAPSKLAG